MDTAAVKKQQVRADGAHAEKQMTVAVPTDLYEEVKRISEAEQWPESKALVLLARLGSKYQKTMEEQLHLAYEAFMNETDAEKKDRLGDVMITTIFGPEAIGPETIG